METTINKHDEAPHGTVPGDLAEAVGQKYCQNHPAPSSMPGKIPYPLAEGKREFISKQLSPLAIRGVMRIGEVLIPGEGEKFPAFKNTDFIKHVDRMLDFMEKEDLDGLKILLSFLGAMPNFVTLFILWLSEKDQSFPTLLGTPLRMISIGLKGMIFTLYYSNIEDTEGKGEQIHQQIGYDAKIVKKEQNLPKFPTSLPPPVHQLPNLLNPNSADVAHIYLRAKQAEADVSRLTLKQRLPYIAALKRVILNRREEIIDIIQRDTKKARTDALVSEIFSLLDHLDFLLNAAAKGLSDIKVKTPLALMGKKSRVFVEPLGTILVISPWNYPFYQAIVPITTSFMAGNATIFKPSEYTPLTGLVEQILDEAGFDSHWVQVVYGDGKVGQGLITGKPDKIFFTGSVATGQKIMAMASQQLTPVELELGGKDPMIVFEDANIERAVSGALWGAMTNTGQSCTAIERLYVHSSIFDKFRDLLISKARQLTQGQDLEGDSDMGLMTTQMQVATVKKHVDEAKKLGARVEVGEDWDGLSDKIPPIIMQNVTEKMGIWKDETFGPVLPMMPFEDEAEVIHLANDSEYGLSASVWSDDKDRAVRVARQLKTGNVSINNVMVTEGNHYLPFGGVKKSGIGRYKGVWGLHAFSNLKSVVIDSNSSKIEANWYPYTKTKYQLFSKLVDGLYRPGPRALLGFVINGLKLETYSNKVGKDFTKR